MDCHIVSDAFSSYAWDPRSDSQISFEIGSYLAMSTAMTERASASVVIDSPSTQVSASKYQKDAGILDA